MYAAINCLGRHDLILVGWAIAICVAAVAGSLTAYRRAMTTHGGHRCVWVVVCALVLGSGVWAMHFMGFLAFQSGMQVSYGHILTGISLVLAVMGQGAGIAVAVRDQTLRGRAVGGAICGLAIAGMHFVGVAAMRLPAEMVWDIVKVGVAIAIGVVGAAISLVAAGDLKRFSKGLVASVAMVLGIAGLHFMAMGAVTLTPGVLAPGEIGLLDGQELQIAVVALVGLILAGGAGMLVMDRLSAMTTLSDLRTGLNCAPSALAFFDRDERLMFWNEGYARILKLYGLTAAKGLPLRDIVKAATADDDADFTPELDVAGRFLSSFEAPDGSSQQVRMAAIHDGGFVVVLTDVTEQLALTQREAEARTEAEAANQAKTEFLANMSHEIRTPLNGVLGMVQIMDRHELSEDQRRRLEVIGTAGHALLSVLNGVLDISKIEAGKLELEIRPFDLEETVKMVGAAYAPLAAQKDVGFVLDVRPGAQGVWLGDAVRLRQVLFNLASNALKFTSEGEIRLKVDVVEAGLEFSVADTGLGIPQDKLASVFEKFTQVDASTTRRFGGTGLGLAICREYVALMGGEIGVTSREGRGSTFTFSLPLKRGAVVAVERKRPKQKPATPQAEGLRILSAEDNLTNQLILNALLEPLGVEITPVTTGRQAVDAFEPGLYDIILMDAQMPELNGLEAAMEIRALELAADAEPTPIIALTANVMRHQVDAYLAAGMNEVVAKPIEASALYRAIETVMSRYGDTRAA